MTSATRPPPAHSPFVRLDVTLATAIERGDVVVPNRRLRDLLAGAWNAHQHAAGRGAWPSARVETLDEHLVREFHDWVGGRGTAAGLRLLDAEAQRAVWLSVVDTDAAVARRAYGDVEAAWRIVRHHDLGDRILSAADTDDQRAFAAWTRDFRARLRDASCLTVADLAEHLADRAHVTATEARPLTFFAFDHVPPAIARYRAARSSRGGRVVDLAVLRGAAAVPALSAWPSPDDEFVAAVTWARTVLAEDGQATVGIVVPDLESRRPALIRQLDAWLRPADDVPFPGAAPYNVSGGTSLAEVPVVHAALEVLRWLGTPFDHGRVRRLLSDPFLAWRQGRSPLSARWPESLDAATYGRLATDERTQRIVALVVTSPRRRSPEAWRPIFESILDAAGWTPAGGEVTAQARIAFTGVLDGIGRLGGLGLTWDFTTARSHLEDACRRTAFAARTPDARLQVLGTLESAGLAFTHLWVCGVDDTRWPGLPRINPFIAPRLQRAAGVPRATLESELSFARRTLDDWRASAREVRFSYAREHGDETRGPSPLVGPWPDAGAAPAPCWHPYAIRRTVPREPYPCETVPAAAVALRRRDAALLQDFARCPFRAFARARLGIEAPRTPRTFPDAADRGTLIHRVLELYTRAFLGARLAFDDGVAEGALDTALASWSRFPAAVRRTERRRTERLLRETVALESARTEHVIEAVETEGTVELAGLGLALRLDRIDRTPTGRVVLDYKTGRGASVADERTELQLALYAVALGDAAGAYAVRLQPAGCAIAGYGADAALLGPPDARRLRTDAHDWQQRLAEWRTHLEGRARALLDGDVRVAPSSLAACEACGLEALCRIRHTPHGD